MAEKIVLLNSGGFDSVVMAYRLRDINPDAKIISLFFNYGQPNYKYECSCALACCEHLEMEFREIILPNFIWTNSDFYEGSVDNQYVEYRNLVFLSYAASIAEAVGAKRIYMATVWNGINGYKDSNIRFIGAFNDMLRPSGITVETPFAYMPKEDLIGLAKDYYISQKDFYSCNNPNSLGNPCGECGDCKILKEMFESF